MIARVFPVPAPVRARDYPSRPVTIVVPYPAGGNVDSAARVIADRLQAKLGQPFIVDNRGGANGNVGTESVATATPDVWGRSA